MKKRQPKASVVTGNASCVKAVALSEGNMIIDLVCPKGEWCLNSDVQRAQRHRFGG